MLVLYSQSQLDGTKDDRNWLDREVVLMKHRRTNTIDFVSASKTFLRNEVDTWAAGKVDMKLTAEEAKLGWSFRHYVGYQRIFNALQAMMLQQTRKSIAAAFTACIVGMKLPVPDYLTKLGDFTKSEVNFDEWVDWTVASICYWPGIMFLGTGKGDNQGRNLDEPNFRTLGDVQLKRVQAGAALLKKLIPTLSLDNNVEVKDLYEKVYTSKRTAATFAIDNVDVRDQLRIDPEKRLKISVETKEDDPVDV